MGKDYLRVYRNILIVVVVFLAVFAIIKDVKAEDNDTPILEKIEVIKDAKSTVYYSEENDHYYIFCKGRWYEMSKDCEEEDDEEEEIKPTEAPIEIPSDATVEEPPEEPTEEPTEEDNNEDEGDYKK